MSGGSVYKRKKVWFGRRRGSARRRKCERDEMNVMEGVVVVDSVPDPVIAE